MPETKTPKPKQAFLKGMKPKSVPDIETAAEEYREARNDWQSRHQPMMEAQEKLHELMKAHKLKRYEYDDEVVEIIGKEKVKVSKKKEPED